MFQCVQCEKEYSEEWKLKSHIKQTHRYKCDQCEKMFKYQDIMKKHILIHHENAKLYCHFYNNSKTCPYNDECVFLHEHSRLCKYGSYCEREYCMFKHECQDKEIETVETEKDVAEYDVAEDIIEITVDKNEAVNDADAISVIVDVDVHENIIDCDSMEINEKSENMKEVEDEITNNIGADLNLSKINNIDNTSGGKRIYACQLCNYQAEKKYDITSHLEDIHNWCYICFSTFDNQENLKKHVQSNHCKI